MSDQKLRALLAGSTVDCYVGKYKLSISKSGTYFSISISQAAQTMELTYDIYNNGDVYVNSPTGDSLLPIPDGTEIQFSFVYNNAMYQEFYTFNTIGTGEWNESTASVSAIVYVNINAGATQGLRVISLTVQYDGTVPQTKLAVTKNADYLLS